MVSASTEKESFSGVAVKYKKVIRSVLKRCSCWQHSDRENARTSMSEANLDSQIEAAERLIMELHRHKKMRKYWDVLRVEYGSVETQKVKAARMNVSHTYYRYMLHHAHAVVALGLRQAGLELIGRSQDVVRT